MPFTFESVSDDSEVIDWVCFLTFGGVFGANFSGGLDFGCLFKDPNRTVLSSSDSLSEPESFFLVFALTSSEESDCSLDSSVELSVADAEDAEDTVDTEEVVDTILLDFFDDETDDDFFDEDTEDDDTVEVAEIILCVVLACLLCSFFSLTFLKNL